MRILGDELESLSCRKLTNRYMEVVTRKAADVQGDTTDLVTGLHGDIVSFYDYVRSGVEGP